MDSETLEGMLRIGARRLMSMARATPEERLDWRPTPSSRIIRDVAFEPAQGLRWALDLLSGEGEKIYTDAFQEAELAVRLAWDFDAAEAVMEENMTAFLARVRQLTTADYKRDLAGPWGGTRSVFEVVQWPLENMHYHTGQVAYVQMMYGDPKMPGYFDNS